MSRSPIDPAELNRLIMAAVGGDRGALERSLQWLTPLIESEVKLRYHSYPIQQQQDAAQAAATWLVEGFSRQFHLFDPSRELLPFAQTVIRRLLSRYHRDQKVIKVRTMQPMELKNDVLASEEDDAENHRLEARSDLQQVLAWSSELEDVDQYIFSEHMVRERSARNVAEALGMAEDAVHQRASRLRERIRRWAQKNGLISILLSVILFGSILARMARSFMQ